MPVVFVGCVPVLADSDPGTYNISAESIEKAVTPRTKAVIAAHISGDPADMDSIMDVAKKYNLYVIEDCAQAHGALYKNKMAGTLGDIAVFSTMFGKHHATGGQGGVVFTKDEDLHMRARRFADRGKPFGLEASKNVRAGLNCNLNDISAVLGSTQLKKLPGFLESRRKTAKAVYEGLGGLQCVSAPKMLPHTLSAYWFLKFKLDLSGIRVDKKQFCDALIAEGIPFMADYRHIQCEYPWFKDKKVLGKGGYPWNNPAYKGDRDPVFDLPNIIKTCDTHFNLRIDEGWGDQEVQDILTALRKVEEAYLK
jgi:dTDP-4-amino-4,6-dideoxygalactose transaminase